MKHPLLTGLLCLLPLLAAHAQLPTDSYSVSAPCPGSAGTPSTLARINTDGSITEIGTVNEAGTGITVNGLGYNDDNQAALYAMRVVQPTFASITAGTPPDLYRIDLMSGAAVNVGPMTAPPTPTTGLTPVGPGRTASDFRQTLNFVGDSDPNGTYYLGGVTFRVSYQTFFNLPLLNTAIVTDVRLYVGTTSLPATALAVAPPVWQQVSTDAATNLILASFQAQAQTYIRSGGTSPEPEGGIQDWVYDKPSGNLVSYIGQSGQYLTIGSPATTPAAVTTTPTVPLPPLPAGTTDANIGSMFSDRFNNVYVVRAGSGEIFRVDNVTGNYENRSFGAALGCNRGDAVSFRQALPLPVTLSRFDATVADATVRISWATATEQLASHFEVERSATATAGWASVGRVAAGNRPNGQAYTYIDAAPLPGTAYYRLAMHDADGTTTYSQVQAVQRAAATLAVYPNPARTEARVMLPTGAATLELVSATGQVVRRFSTTTGGSVDLPIAGLRGGVYLLRVQQGGMRSNTRLIVLE